MLPFLCLMGADDNLNWEAMIYVGDANSFFIWLPLNSVIHKDLPDLTFKLELYICTLCILFK